MRGVVLGERFIERPIGTSRIYEEIDNLKDPKAGIRVWYVRDNPGFIFLSYDEVIRVVKIGRLTENARKMIEDRVRMKIAQAQMASEEERRRKEENLKKAGIGLTEQEDQTRMEEEIKDLDKRAYEKINKQELLMKLPEDVRKLLEDFPPEQGWSPELYERIKPRVNKAKVEKQFVGLPIAYRKFVDNYALWQSAMDMLKTEEKNAFEKIRGQLKKEREDAKKKLEKEAQEEKDEVEKEEKKKKAIADKIKAMEEEAKKEEEKNKAELTKKEEKEPIDDTKNIIQESISQLLYAKTSDKKIEAMRVLGKLGSKAAIATQSLRMSLKDTDALVRREAIQALGRIKEPKSVVMDALADCLELGDLLMRREAASAFFLLGKDSASKFDLIASAATLDEDAKVRYRAIRTLEMIGDTRAVTQVQTRLWDSDPAVQVATASTLLTLMENPEPLYDWIGEPLVKGLSHEEDQVRILASEVIKKLAERVTEEKILLSLQETLNNLLPKAKEEIKYNLQDALKIVEDKIKQEKEKKEKEKKEREKEDSSEFGSEETLPEDEY